MEEFYKVILTSAFTILGAIIIFFATKLIELKYIQPFFNFKNKFTKTYGDILFFKNILTNRFNREEINDKFFDKVLKAQEVVRIDWSELLSSYHQSRKWPLTYFIPKNEEVNTLQENLLYLSNATIVYLNPNAILPDDTTERNNQIKQIEKIFVKYI